MRADVNRHQQPIQSLTIVRSALAFLVQRRLPDLLPRNFVLASPSEVPPIHTHAPKRANFKTVEADGLADSARKAENQIALSASSVFLNNKGHGSLDLVRSRLLKASRSVYLPMEGQNASGRNRDVVRVGILLGSAFVIQAALPNDGYNLGTVNSFATCSNQLELPQ
jgi:hypothetical protein